MQSKIVNFIHIQANRKPFPPQFTINVIRQNDEQIRFFKKMQKYPRFNNFVI